jgi:hypothetical protein
VKQGSVAEEFVDGHLIPAEYFQRIEVVYDGQSVDFMETRDDPAVLDIRQAADVKDELGSATLRRELKTRSLDVAVG